MNQNLNSGVDDFELLCNLKQDGSLLAFETDDVKDNKKAVLAAVSENGIALQYASHRLKQDSEVILAAIKQNAGAIRFVNSAWQSKVKYLAMDKSIIESDQDKMIAELLKNTHY